jgi:hypothetical protein
MSEHIPNSLGVVHVARTAPRHHTTICQNCIKREVCRMDLLNTLELIPDSSAVTTTARTTPRHNTTIYQTCSNGEACSVNLLNSLADPWLQRCHHLHLDCPTSQHYHLPKSQQKPHLSPESSEHFWADLGPLWCNLLYVYRLMQQFGRLQHTDQALHRSSWGCMRMRPLSCYLGICEDSSRISICNEQWYATMIVGKLQFDELISILMEKRGWCYTFKLSSWSTEGARWEFNWPANNFIEENFNSTHWISSVAIPFGIFAPPRITICTTPVLVGPHIWIYTYIIMYLWIQIDYKYKWIPRGMFMQFPSRMFEHHMAAGRNWTGGYAAMRPRPWGFHKIPLWIGPWWVTTRLFYRQKKPPKTFSCHLCNPTSKCELMSKQYLVGGFNPYEKYESQLG